MKTKLSPRKVLETFGTLYYDEAVLKTMPKKQEGTLEFFTLGKYVTDDELEKEYEARGLTPADPVSIAEYHQANPTFADTTKFTATHWKDEKGWCFATFYRWYDKRDVHVSRNNGKWNDNWAFGGVRKSSDTKLYALEPLSLELRIKALESWKAKVERIFNV